MFRDLTRLLGPMAVEGGGSAPVRVAPERREGVAAAFRWAHSRGVTVRSAHRRDLAARKARPGEVLLVSAERLTPPLVLQRDAGTVRVGAGTTGAELATGLYREGRCPWPRSAPFLREPIGPYLAGPGLAAEFVAFSMWESPLMALEGVLVDGRTIHVGVAPRSAAGPDYRTFFLGTGDRLGMITSAVWRTVDRSVLRLFAARFSGVDAALSTARAHCRVGGWRPFAGWIGRGEDPARWREGSKQGDCLLLLAHRADGLRADLLDDQLSAVTSEAGGTALPARAARAWIEESFLDVCRHGKARLDEAGPARLEGQLGTLRVAMPWTGAGPLWQALEALGERGPLTIAIAAEAPRPEGVVLHLRLCRRGRSRIGLGRAVDRVRLALEGHGGWIAGLHDGDGSAVDVPQVPTPANQLLDAVAASLRSTAAAGPSNDGEA